MTISTFQAARFYIRPQRGLDDETPLRIKVWISPAQNWIYMRTDIRITPRQFRREFTTDGTPSITASPIRAREVERYRAAALLVLASAVVNNRLEMLTSEYLNRRVNGIVARMRENADTGSNQPIVVGASPMEKAARKVCLGCAYYDETCSAPWGNIYEADIAAERAAVFGECKMRKEAEKGGAL